MPTPLSDGPISGDTSERQPVDFFTVGQHPALHRLALLDTPAEQAFDRLTRLAAKILHTPAALLTFVDGDRSFFKSSVGLPEQWTSRRETPLPHSVCQHVVAMKLPLVINDTRADPLLSDNQAVADLQMVAYLGIPLVTSDGHALGTFAVIDTVPREWAADDVTTLSDLAASALTEIELRAETGQRLVADDRLRLLEAAVLNANDAVLIAEADPAESAAPRIVFVNDSFSRMTGYSSDEIVGKLYHFLPGPEVERSQSDSVHSALANWKPCRVEGLRHRKDGSEYWVELNIVPIADSTGHYSHWVVVKRDISEKKATAKALRESEIRRLAILESALDCIITIDERGRILEYNPSAERTFGYPRESVMGQSLAGLIIPAAHREAHAGGMEHFLSTGEGPILNQRSEITALRADGTEIPVELEVTVVGLNGKSAFTAFLRDITDRKQAEILLQESEERLRFTLDCTQVSEWELDFATGASRRSLLHDQIFGYDHMLPEWTYDIFLHKHVHIDDRPTVDKVFRTAFAESNGWEIEYPIIRLDGQKRFIWAKGFNHWDGTKLVRAAGVLMDITERKQTEEALRRSEQELSDFFDNATVGLHLVGGDGLVRRVNEAELRLLGYDREEYVGHHISEFHADPEVIEDILTKLSSAETLRDYPARLRCKDGSFRNVVISSNVLWKDGQFVNTRCFTLDVTERKQAEEALRRSEVEMRRLALIAQRTDNAVILTDRQGRIEWVNEGFTRITEYRLEEVLGKTPGSVLIGPDTDPTTSAHMREQLLQGKGFQVEILNYAKSGRTFWLAIEAQPLHDDQGMLTGFMAIERDITERKQYEAGLTEAKEEAERANQAKSEFFSRMSHELRTPLNVILGFGQLLELDELSAPQRESAEQIGKGGRHLLALINEVLDITHIEAGEGGVVSPEEVDLDEAVGEVLRMVQPLADQAGLRVFPPPSKTGGGAVLADLQRLKQVLLNLLSNAIKYNQPGGTVTITCAEATDAMLRISVTDTGRGIPAEKLHRLFSPFDRLEAEQMGVEGTGLGLTLSKGLVEAMGGTMGVESTLGIGSTFWFELRRIDPAAALAVDNPTTVGAPEKNTPTVSVTVLYVEDNPANFRLVERILELRPGVRLLPAMQGRLGLDMAREHHPDVIFLDLHLPDLPGDEVLRELRDDTTRDIPVVMLSADATQHHIERLLAAGASHYLVKPIQVQEFLRILDETLGKRER